MNALVSQLITAKVKINNIKIEFPLQHPSIQHVQSVSSKPFLASYHTFHAKESSQNQSPNPRSPIVCATTQGVHEGGFSSSTGAHDCSHFLRGKLTSNAWILTAFSAVKVCEFKRSFFKNRISKKIKPSLPWSCWVTLPFSSECMLCIQKLVSKDQPSRMHCPFDFNFTPTSSKPTYAAGRMGEWFSTRKTSEVHRLKGISNGKPMGNLAANQLTQMALILYQT